MIFLKLRCAQAHEYDGWFQSAASFAEQCAAQRVACPHCGITHMEKALMAPAIGKHGSDDSNVSLPHPPSPSGSIPMPDHCRAACRQLRPFDKGHCENLGRRFAGEAIKRRESVAGGETFLNGIYKPASAQARDILAEKSIEFLSIPWGPIDDA